MGRLSASHKSVCGVLRAWLPIIGRSARKQPLERRVCAPSRGCRPRPPACTGAISTLSSVLDITPLHIPLPRPRRRRQQA